MRTPIACSLMIALAMFGTIGYDLAHAQKPESTVTQYANKVNEYSWGSKKPSGTHWECPNGKSVYWWEVNVINSGEMRPMCEDTSQFTEGHAQKPASSL